MSFFPDIEDGKLIEKEEQKPWRPKKIYGLLKEEERLAELNNLGRKEVTEDFADSPFADRV